jgi:hypothetical protein
VGVNPDELACNADSQLFTTEDDRRADKDTKEEQKRSEVMKDFYLRRTGAAQDSPGYLRGRATLGKMEPK